MTLKNYWPFLSRALMAWLATLTLLFLGRLSLEHLRSDVQQQLDDVHGKILQRQQQVDSLTRAHSALHMFHQKGLRWQQLGLLSPASADRIERDLVALQQSQSLPHVMYEIGLPVVCAAGACESRWPVLSAEAIPFTMTPLQLRWRVAHEADVLKWLQLLSEYYSGILLVRQCSWKHQQPARQIEVQCGLELFNFPHALPAHFNLSSLQTLP